MMDMTVTLLILMFVRYLDYVSIMTYDYHGQWDKKTGHVAPMYQV